MTEEKARPKCVLCDHLDLLCRELDGEGGSFCQNLLEKLEEGSISAREFADELVRRYGVDKISKALKALAEKVKEEVP